MFGNILKLLALEPFKISHKDPFFHFTKKVGSKPFMLVILGHQQLKYARARIRKGVLELGKPTTAFVDNFQNAEQDAAWVVDFISEAGETKNILLGLNCMFSNLRIYPLETRLRDVKTALDEKPEEEVGRSYDKQTCYFPSQAGDHLSLNGIEKEKISRPLDKFQKWGFDIVSVFHYPTAVISYVFELPLNWEEPGLLIFFSQRLIFFMGWTPSEVVVMRSKLFAEAQRNPTGQKPLMNSIQREIETTLAMVTGRPGGANPNVYTYHDKQDPTFNGIEAMYKNSRPLVWPANAIESELKPYPEPDLSIVNETDVVKA
jgi:hypothetical protein